MNIRWIRHQLRSPFDAAPWILLWMRTGIITACAGGLVAIFLLPDTPQFKLALAMAVAGGVLVLVSTVAYTVAWYRGPSTSGLVQFSLRDLFWIATAAALATGWLADRDELISDRDFYRAALRSHGDQSIPPRLQIKQKLLEAQR